MVNQRLCSKWFEINLNQFESSWGCQTLNNLLKPTGVNWDMSSQLSIGFCVLQCNINQFEKYQKILRIALYFVTLTAINPCCHLTNKPSELELSKTSTKHARIILWGNISWELSFEIRPSLSELNDLLTLK